jgi:hypothetical protein
MGKDTEKERYIMKIHAIATLALSVLALAGCAADASEEPGGDETLGQTSEAFSVSSYGWWYLPHGGTGGTETTLRCRAGDVITGIYGRAGNVVDSLGIICQHLYPDGSLGPRYNSQLVGGTGGTVDYSTTCSFSNGVLVGLSGQSGTYVDFIQPICARPPYTSTFVNWTTMNYGSWTHGTSFRDDVQPYYVLDALVVRHGTVIDSVRAHAVYVGTR